jgi:hypothetical protein
MRWLALVAGVLLASACSSPEARRARGGGPGADVGNHGTPLEIQGKKDPFHATPLKAPGR